jgi:hypothetical protein
VLAACGLDDREPSILSRGEEQGSPPGAASSSPAGGEAQPSERDSAKADPDGDDEAEPPSTSAASTEDVLAPTSPPVAPPQPEPRLVASAPSHAFENMEVNAGQSSFTWAVTNAGDAVTGPLEVSRIGDGDFSADTGCSAPLSPGDSCSVSVRFAPIADGDRGAAIVVEDGRGASTSLAVSGRGSFRLTVDVVGGGEVSANRAGLECTGTVCTGLFDRGAIGLDAHVENGSGRFFTGWSVRECRANQSCDLALSESARIVAQFSPTLNNLVFVTSTTYPGNLGGLAAYDAACNRHASEAGINDGQGGAFVAAMSDSRTTLRSRLGAARGWVRMDGLTFGDTVDDILGALRVRYSIDYTERGELVHGPLGGDIPLSFAMTGTMHDLTSAGAPILTCNDWTSIAESSLVVTGQVAAGVNAWISSRNLSCSFDRPVICMGNTRSVSAPITPFDGKQMWTSTPYRTGAQTPDQKCQSERPPGVANAAAFVAYSYQPAEAVLDLDATYVRPDGVLIGTGRDVAALDLPGAGPWVLADSSSALYVFSRVWSGAGTPMLTAGSDTNCSDWRSTNPEEYAYSGDYAVSEARFFFTGTADFCDQAFPIYCVER